MRKKIDEEIQIDKDQQDAITYGEGPLLIVAGAGTGKTKVITERIAYLINEKKVKPSEIIALTFSEKAAAEMVKRVDELIPYGMVDVHISTFHSFGYDIIDENFTELRIAPDWKLLQKADSIIFIAENIDKFDLHIYRPLNNPHKYVSYFSDFISKLKDNLITPEEYVKFANEYKENAKEDAEKEIAEKHLELAGFYKKYEELKLENNFVDYGDLIFIPYFLLKEKKSVLEKYQKRYKYILIDEFQDTNYAQFELIKLIAEKSRNINVVGDDDQMIYRFRGAAISNIMGFKDYYKDAKVVVLKTNYRSVQPILEAAYKLIKNNTDRLEDKLNISKKLESKYKPTHKIQSINFEFFKNYSLEADFVAEKIKEFIQKDYYKKNEIAVLVRSKIDAPIFLKTFEKYGIDYKFSGDEGLYNKEEIRFLINFCKMLNTPYEFNPIFDVAISEFYNIGPYTMSKIGNRAKDFSMTIYDMMKKINDYPELEIEPEEIKKIEKLLNDIDFYVEKIKQKWNAGEILYDFLKTRKIFDDLLKKQDIESQVKIANISKFFEILKQFSISEEYDTLPNFVKYIELRQMAGDNPQEDILEDIEEDSVQVLTVHKAKGLEFKVVFMVALVQDKFPVRRRGDFPLPLPEKLIKDIIDEETYFKEEERRLFYVAMTRAKDALFLTASQKYEGKSERKISMFLEEIGIKKPEPFEEIEEAKVEKFKYFEKQTTIGEIKIAKKEKVIKLSNYQIDDYLTCPFKYKLIHILKIPIKDDPAVMYGQAMHKVVAEFYKAKQEKKDLKIDDLKLIFKSMWKPYGFISQEHEKRRFETGLNAIEKFFKKESENNIVPVYIEKDFEFKLSEKLVIRGRWDRVDMVDGKAIIIDYKTSDVEDKNIEQLKEKLKSDSISRQLKLYSLAYREIFNTDNFEVGIYFVENCVLITKKFQNRFIDNYKEKIFEVAENIEKENFEATPSSFVCSYCAFFNICPYSKADILF